MSSVINGEWHASFHKLPMAVDKESAMAMRWPRFNNTEYEKSTLSSFDECQQVHRLERTLFTCFSLVIFTKKS